MRTVECDVCEERIDPEDVFHVDGLYLCEDCFDNYDALIDDDIDY